MSTIDWYTSRDGAITGPFSYDEIEEQIRASRLTLLDLVYSESFGRWMVLNEIPEFQSAFQKAYREKVDQNSGHRSGQRSTTQPSRRGDWIVLKSFESTSHVLGPFEKNQIFEMLSTGELKYADSVWRPGDAGWTKLSECDEFDRRQVNDVPRSAPVNFEADPSMINRIPIQDILGNIARLDRGAVKTEPLPAEAQGEDLTQSLSHVTGKIKRVLVIGLLFLGAISTGEKVWAGNPKSKGDPTVELKKVATEKQRERFALYYSSRKLQELAKSLSERTTLVSERKASIEFDEAWKTDFEKAQNWLKEVSTQKSKFYPMLAADLQKNSKDLWAEFERVSQSKRGPANSENRLEGMRNAFSRIRSESAAAVSPEMVDEEPPSSGETSSVGF